MDSGANHTVKELVFTVFVVFRCRVNMKEYGQTHEHGGTHMDAPLHFIKKGLSVDKLDTTRMVGCTLIF